jgi:hypothetical protein
MSIHTLRRTLAAAIGGALAVGALAGPAMAATDGGTDGASQLTCRKAGGVTPSLTVRKAGERPESSIIGVL